MSSRVLVVGAGPAGLTSALELTRRGIETEIIEKRGEASNLSRAVGILPASMEYLKSSGAAEAIRAAAIPVRQVVLHDQARKVATIRLDLLDNPNHRIYGLPQDETEAILAAQVAHHGGTVRYGHALEKLEQDASGAAATINGKSHQYDYVIGADGVDSIVRQQLGISFEGYRLDSEWSIADVEVRDWPYIDSFAAFLLQGGRMVIAVPIGPERIRIVAAVPDALAAIPLKPHITNIRRASSFHIDIRQAESLQKGRVFLVGDAGHCHSPVGGRGMNLGIADACELARCLDEGRPEDYSRLRHPIAAQTIAQTEGARRFIMSDSGFKKGLLFSAASVISKIGWLNRAAMKRILNL